MNLDVNFITNNHHIRLYSFHEISDLENNNIDIFVDVDGTTWAGDVATVENVKSLMNKSEFRGVYYCKHGIIVNNLKKETLIKAIKVLIEEGTLEYIFVKSDED